MSRALLLLTLVLGAASGFPQLPIPAGRSLLQLRSVPPHVIDNIARLRTDDAFRWIFRGLDDMGVTDEILWATDRELLAQSQSTDEWKIKCAALHTLIRQAPGMTSMTFLG
ncbi:hypothetical protein JKP88DRAFT_248802 [Tribonema minus]|uniref:Uncharacterized protein n=1 Tax=Tribonema minus TaxID=303371 RepID=A0A835YPF3_9STRA|nr:hypothetical protein JKP88DRAFT_248802 [Tribonema minus]